MGPDTCAFKGAISDAFGFLFTEDRFVFTTGLCARLGECQMQTAAPPVCQIAFSLEQDSFPVLLGHLAAPATIAARIDGVTWWHDFYDMMNVEDHLHPNLMHPVPPWSGAVTLSAQTQITAEIPRHYRARLLDGLASDGASDWWQGYVAFCRTAHHTTGAMA